MLAPFVFPKAPTRLQEYLTAREQYDLMSAMARNQVTTDTENAVMLGSVGPYTYI